MPTGDVLIGFNKAAFQSYGLKDSLNAAMSEASAKQYVETLNHLISEHHIRLVNTYAVYWFGHSLENDDNPFTNIVIPSEPNKADETRPKELLDAINQGKRPDLLNNHYYCFIVSGQSGRVMIRDFQQGQMKELLENINAWFDDLSIVQHNGTRTAKPPKFLAIVGCLFRDLKDAPAPLISDLWRCAMIKYYLSIIFKDLFIMSISIKETTSIKLDKEAKAQAQLIFKELGLTMGDAFNLFLSQVNLHRGIPFEIKIPNKTTKKIIKEARLDKNVADFSLDDLK